MRLIACLIGLIGALAVLPESAEDNPVSEDWQFQMTPYLWALAVDGNATVKGVKTEPSVILDDQNYAFMVEADARKGRIGIFGNAMYART